MKLNEFNIETFELYLHLTQKYSTIEFLVQYCKICNMK